jgi:hypothetical protein
MFVCFERNAAAAQLLSWQQRGASLIPFRHIERSKDVARDLHPASIGASRSCYTIVTLP